MIAALTGAGFSAAAGLNAFLPLLIFSVFARFTSVIELPSHLGFLESWWVIGLSLFFLIIEAFIDKIPGVDHVNDVLQSLVRPVVGGFLFSAAAASEVTDVSAYWQDSTLLGGSIGAVLALTVHVCKAVARPAVNAATGGSGAPIASFTEDVISLALCIAALFLPVLVVFLFAAMGIALYRIVTSSRRRRRRRAEIEAHERSQRVHDELEGARESLRQWWRKWSKELGSRRDHREAKELKDTPDAAEQK